MIIDFWDGSDHVERWEFSGRTTSKRFKEIILNLRYFGSLKKCSGRVAARAYDDNECYCNYVVAWHPKSNFLSVYTVGYGSLRPLFIQKGEAQHG